MLEEHLKEGEKILWQGRPNTSYLDIGPRNFILIIGAAALSLFFMIPLVQEMNGVNTDLGKPKWVRLTGAVGLPSVAVVGAYLMILADKLDRQRMIFAITNLRALTLRTGGRHKLAEISLGPTVNACEVGRYTLRIVQTKGYFATRSEKRNGFSPQLEFTNVDSPEDLARLVTSLCETSPAA